MPAIHKADTDNYCDVIKWRNGEKEEVILCFFGAQCVSFTIKKN